MLSQLNKFKPRYDPNTNAYDWSAIYSSFPTPLNTFLFLYFNPLPPSFPLPPAGGTAWMTNFESVKFYQGTCDNNQTTGNQTAQSYMSCLEDRTKKINFTKNTKENNFITASIPPAAPAALGLQLTAGDFPYPVANPRVGFWDATNGPTPPFPSGT